MSVQNSTPGSPGPDTAATPGSSTPTTAETAGKVGEAASRVAGQAQDAGRKVAEDRFADSRDKAAGEIDAVGGAVDDLASSLEDQGSPFASYAGELSSQLSSLSEKVSQSSLDELAASTRSLARTNPAVFLLGSVAIGLAASRFFKAAGQEIRADQSGNQRSAGLGRSALSGETNRQGLSTPVARSDGSALHSSVTSEPAATRNRQGSASAASLATPGAKA